MRLVKQLQIADCRLQIENTSCGLQTFFNLQSAICNLQSGSRAIAARAGAAATELAIWLPFLGLMFVVAVDFCRVYYASQTIQNSALAGAMYASGAASANPSNPSGQDPAVGAALAEAVSLNPPLKASDVSVSIAKGIAQVTVTYDFPLLATWPGSAGKVTLTRTVSMALVPQPGS
jgi:Flp pilus assembly protein TadG